MNRIRHAPSRRRESASPHRDFLLILPVVEKRAKFAFRFLPPVDREEAIAEAVAAAFVSFVRLKARGKFPAAFPVVLAAFAVLHVRNGRHVGGSCSSGEVTAFAAQRRHGFQLHLLAPALAIAAVVAFMVLVVGDRIAPLLNLCSDTQHLLHFADRCI